MAICTSVDPLSFSLDLNFILKDNNASLKVGFDIINKLRITATSNILPKNKAWDTLNNYIQISYGEYGDWPKVLGENKMVPILWVFLM